MFAQMYPTKKYDKFEKKPKVFVCLVIFLISSLFFFLNLLIAQMTCAYQSVYEDMVGFARLERIEVIRATIPQVSQKRWGTFVESQKLDRRLEFNEGDIGLKGGIQIQELASLNPTTRDTIRRFGGSTSQDQQWPEEENTGEQGTGSDDRFDRLEQMLQKAFKRLTGSGKKKKGMGSSGMGSSDGAGDMQSGSGAEGSGSNHGSAGENGADGED
jgi:hypothetical protein